MHRSYRPVKPTHNKLLQHRWDSNDYYGHRRKVMEARPTIDTRPPETYMHLHLKLKKLQMEEDRLSTIERDNRILLQKMSTIMKARGRVDNMNNYEYKSLNREKRMRELLRVSHENQHILKRITAKKPQYDHTEWEKDWETNQQYMDQISAYPKDWWKKQGEDDTPRSNRRGRRASYGSSRAETDRSTTTSSPRRRNDDDEVDDYEEEKKEKEKKEKSKRKTGKKESKKEKKKEKEEEEEEEDDDKDMKQKYKEHKDGDGKKENKEKENNGGKSKEILAA